jgi:hypothetical protein
MCVSTIHARGQGARQLSLSANRRERQALQTRLHDSCFPNGDEAARSIRGVRIQERGEIRASAGVRWTPFTATQTSEASRSAFRWEARVGPVAFIDAYEDGHGVTAVQPPGSEAVDKTVGSAIDQASLQRYLASIPLCPPILINHPSLVWTTSSPQTLRVRDREDPSGAIVYIELNQQGQPVAVRADRARMVGRDTVMTPWRGVYSGFHEWQGMMVPAGVEVFWGLEAGEFQYYRSETTSLELL